MFFFCFCFSFCWYFSGFCCYWFSTLCFEELYSDIFFNIIFKMFSVYIQFASVCRIHVWISVFSDLAVVFAGFSSEFENESSSSSLNAYCWLSFSYSSLDLRLRLLLPRSLSWAHPPLPLQAFPALRRQRHCLLPVFIPFIHLKLRRKFLTAASFSFSLSFFICNEMKNMFPSSRFSRRV